MRLTSKQEAIFTFINDYQKREKIPPSSRTIQKHFRYGSQTSVVQYLKALAAKGVLQQLSDGAWGAKANEVQVSLPLPIYGEIPAGPPGLREQQQLRSIPIDPVLFGVSSSRHHLLWGLDIKGDSTINAQIRSGDIGIFEPREPRVGEIIAALVNETEVTLKRLVEVDGKLVLRAENPRYADIVPSTGLECQGVLVGVIRTQPL